MPDYSEPYARFNAQEMILRDELAIDRTILANERTFLAYVRTALAFAVVGASCLKFLPPIWALLTAILFFAAAVALSWFGITRSYRVSRRLAIVRPPHPRQ